MGGTQPGSARPGPGPGPHDDASGPGSAREEAERLVATVLAAATSRGAGSWGPLAGIVSGVLGHSAGPSRPSGGNATGGGFATGSPECCVCPVCRGIAALRDPSPEFAERLATGAGDLAAGVASLLRAFGSEGTPGAPDERPAGPAAPTGGRPAAGPDPDHVWREATRTGHDSASAPDRDVWSAATRAEDAVVPAAAAPPVDDAGPAPSAHRSAADRPAVPASRVPDGTGGEAPGDRA
ncbi:hypothetical protein ACFY3U_05225 [Micromonospora sp. NPDC000089]|uniref:hypothetical protein n=1 Tax=unclassified Micromonospora TaxID=2617518 RepID=UPI003687E977